MDINERLAARRKEIAIEKEGQRIAAQQQRQAELDAARQAEQARIAAMPPPPDSLPLAAQPAQPKRVVEIDLDTKLFEKAVERMTKMQVAIFCVLAALALIGLTQDPLRAIFWTVCALGYLAVTISGHVDKIKNPKEKE